MASCTNESGLMRITEVAQYLNVSRSKVYQLMGEGELAWIKLGKVRRIPRTQLLQLMDRHTMSVPSCTD